MYVIPIFYRTIRSFDNTVINQVWILLERNGNFCTFVESLEDAMTYATENDVPLKGPPIVTEHAIFLPVDDTSHLLDQFYTWNETRPDEQPMRTVWRPFIWIFDTDINGDIWGTNAYLKRLMVGDNLSVFQILTEYLGQTITTVTA
jgi:hypothetical protein